MIADSSRKLFDVVLIWKLDRFSRDRYDSGESISEITRSFNDRGLKTKKGKDFRIAGISLFLKNRKYRCTWRAIPHDFPKWQNVRCHYDIWSSPDENGVMVDHYCDVTNHLSMLKKILVDGGYSGENFANAMNTLSGTDVEVVKRNELHKFAVLPKRWFRHFRCLRGLFHPE